MIKMLAEENIQHLFVYLQAEYKRLQHFLY